MTKLGIASMAAVMCGTASAAATLLSTALDPSDTDVNDALGGNFRAPGGFDAAPAIAGVTTTVVGTIGDTLTLNAVSAANGMNVTYDVVFTPYVFSFSDSQDFTGGSSATLANGNSLTIRNRLDGRVKNNQFANTIWDNGGGDIDVEFFRVMIGNVQNTGATVFNLDGATALSFDSLSGMAVYDTFVAGTAGTTLGSAGTGTIVSGSTDIALSSASTSFAIAATANDAASNFENRWQAVAVQFTSVPEPSSTALIGLGGLALILRRRK